MPISKFIALILILCIGIGTYYIIRSLSSSDKDPEKKEDDPEPIEETPKESDDKSNVISDDKSPVVPEEPKPPVPKPLDCPTFARYENTDIPGFDFVKSLQNQSEDQCKEACLKNGCHWYNYVSDKKICYLKKAKSFDGKKSYFRLSGVPVECPQYAIYDNTDISGFDLSNSKLTKKTTDQCQSECKNKGCTWFTYQESNQTCWLKKAPFKASSVTGIPVPK